MSAPNIFASEILDASASAYAGYAASLFLERNSPSGDAPAWSSMEEWKANLTQRVLELSAALGVAKPRLFVSRVLWSEKAFRARGISTADLEVSLRCLREVLGEKLPETAGKEAMDYLDRALRELSAGEPSKGGLDPEEPNGRLALRYLQTVLEGDTRGAVDLVKAAVDDGLDPRKAYLEVLIPALREVGEMWHQGDINIAEEHLVTAATERAMSTVLQCTARAPSNGRTALAAAVAGNAHGLAVRVIADFFELAGWRAVGLGANIPPSDLVAAVQYFDADLVLLSAARINDFKAVKKTIKSLRGLEGREVKILVGGAAFREAPDLWRELGADGHAGSADEAVELGEGLLS